MTLTIGVGNQPAPHVPAYFEDELRKLGGLNPHGLPNLRIVWGQDEMRMAYGRLRMKYLAAIATIRKIEEDPETGLLIAKDEQVDIGKPRFMLEEWTPPGLLKAGWDDAIFGAFPTEGRWDHIFTLQTADGAYMPPGEDALQVIRKAVWERSRVSILHAQDEAAHYTEINKELQKAASKDRAAYLKKLAEVKDRVKQQLAPHAHRLITDKPNAGRGY